MLYVSCKVVGKGERVEQVKVTSVHNGEEAARKASLRWSASGHDMRAIPVSMYRPGSVRPKRGDVLGVMSEASNLVALAPVRP